MADTLTTITNLINSPPGQLVAGGVLAGIVWKFFDKVEAVLTDQTKFEIAVWLVGVKVGQKGEPWPDTFAKLFDRVFGESHFSWKCLWRSTLASYGTVSIVVFTSYFLAPSQWIIASRLVVTDFLPLFGISLVANVVPDFLSLLETRCALWLLRLVSHKSALPLLLVDAYLTAAFAGVSTMIGITTFFAWEGYSHFGEPFSPGFTLRSFLTAFLPSRVIGTWLVGTRALGVGPLWYFPAFFTSVWLWLYAGSGFLLKAARRFDIGFQWFNRKFDIEKKPLSAIGLVAGALVAVVYWGFAFGSYLMKK
jgi:hypothetical protein